MRGVLLAADTTRSSAYAQVLRDRNVPMDVVLYGAGLPDRTGRGSPGGGLRPRAGEPVVRPGVPVAEVVRGAGWRHVELPDHGANDPEVVEVVGEYEPDVVLFSGHGGEFVRSPLLELGPDVLHVHAGRLPRYRGSTTLYYMLLEEREVEVTAILLTAELDAGNVVGARRHDPPPAGTDLDHVLDPVLRADLAVDVLAERATSGRWPEQRPQPVSDERHHYVIHPVLKHLALLSLPETTDG